MAINETLGFENMSVDESGTSRADGAKSIFNTGSSIMSLEDLLLSNYKNSEVMEKYAEAIKDALKDIQGDFKIIKVPKSKFDLDYDSVVIAIKDKKGNVNYLIHLLEASGPEPVAPSIILEEMKTVKRDQSLLIVPADAFDNYLYDTVEEILAKIFNVSKAKIKSFEGFVIPHNEEVVTANIAAKYTHDIIVFNAAIENGEVNDLCVTDFKSLSNGNGYFELNLAFNNAPTKNRLGRIYKSDFTVTSSFNGQPNGKRRITKKEIALTSGYMDFIVSEVSNQFGKSKMMAKPLIIINESMGLMPTLNFHLLSIINALTFASPNVLKQGYIEKDAGPLNYFFNFNGEQGKPGVPVSFKDPEADPHIIGAMLQEHFNYQPVFFTEIELNGDIYPQTTGFVALADPAHRAEANNLILERASVLINKDIPKDIQVLGSAPHEVPTGEFIDANGEVRDIREIDTIFLINNKVDDRILENWIYSNLPVEQCMGLTGKTNFELKLEILDALTQMLGLQLVITGRAIRIPLSSLFLQVLEENIISAGYAPRFNAPMVSNTPFADLRSIAGVYSGAEFQGNAFAPSTPSRVYVPRFNGRGFRG